jgi:hypothetical protein
MEIKKEGQVFYKGMHRDFSPAFQPEDTYRDATNIELTSAGEQMIINQIKSCANIDTQELNPAYPPNSIGSVNILGYTVAKAKINGVSKDGFVVYAHVKQDAVSGLTNSGIYFFAQNGTFANGTIYKIYEGTDLNFSETTSIDSFFTEDRENKSVYFTDFSNTIRKIEMDDSFWLYASAGLMNVISDASYSMNMSITSIGNDGVLLAGTYQLAYRFKKTTPIGYTKWSTFTNPVPAIPLAYTSGTTINYYGGKVGQSTSRSINYSITVGPDEVSGTYDSVEIAVVKNNDGGYVQQKVAYINTISNIAASGALTGTYKGTEAEYEIDIDEITAPDAPVETVKTIVEKDNRLLAGNIKYFNRRIADNEVNIIEAKTIRRLVDYENPINTNLYRGYFRDEVYRFGVTYHDEYGNWSPVKPLDFSNFSANDNKPNTTSQTGGIAIGGVNYNSNLITITGTFTTGVSGFAVGESIYCSLAFSGGVSLQFTTEVQAVAVGQISILIPGALFSNYPSLTGVTGSAGLQPLRGNAYSHSSDQFSWKFPKREHLGVSTGTTGTFGTLEYGTYSLLAATGASSLPQALGLGLSVSGHPEWARGMAVVRMDRDKDILYQTPIVPASLYLGVSTPGKFVTSTTSLDYTATDGIGELDYLGPKCLKMGAARNMQVLTPNALSGSVTLSISGQPTYNLPTYQGINTIPENRMLWKKAFAPAVDYVYNTTGSPLINTPDLVVMNVDIVDVCGFKLSDLTPITPTVTYSVESNNNRANYSTPANYVEARVYSCLDHKQHWYPNNFVNMRTYTSPGVAGSFVNTYRRKIHESFLQVNGLTTASFVGSAKASDAQSALGVTGVSLGYYTRTLLNLNSLSTEKLIIPITMGQSAILLDSAEKASSNSGGVSRAAVNYLVGGTELTLQQKGNSIMDMTDSGTAALFTTNVENQRSLAISLNQYLDDPLYLITANYCPLSAGQFGYIPRDRTVTGRVNTYASVAFAQYLDNFSLSSTGNQLRNGLIYNNPFMNITWNGSYGQTSTTPNNRLYVPSYPWQDIVYDPGDVSGTSYIFAPIENSDGGVEFSFTGSVASATTAYNQYSNTTGDIQQALYVANLRAGKSDSRYGNPNQIQEYIHTGAYQKINSTGQTVALEVWGGDCFISKYRYKVNDEYNVPGYYLPTESGTGGFDFNIKGCCESLGIRGPSRVFKTGTKVSPEYIEMYTEGEANAFYTSDQNRFPYYNLSVATSGTVDHYRADAFYEYNFGYSIENFPKKFFSENRLITVSNNYPARLIYSDVKSTDLSQDGFSRFRAFNFFDMDEKYGKVTKIALLNDNEPIVGQDDSISLLYVNKSLTTLQDNQTLAVQGGTYISDNTPPKYLTTNYGVELIRCMIPTENGVYALDTKRGVLINILDGAKIVSLSRMEQYFREKFSETYVPWLEHTIQMSYDRVDKVLYIMGALSGDENPNDDQDTFAWLSYGVKLDAFMSNLDWTANGHGGKLGNRPMYLFDLNGSTYMIQTHRNNQNSVADIHINQWKGGNDYLKLLDGTHIQPVDANIEYVFNKNVNEPKVLDVVGINSQSQFSQFNITAYNDSSSLTPSSTNDLTTGIVSRLGMSSTNVIRDGTGKRLVGVYHTVKLWFSNTTSAINLRSAINQFRKVFR